MKLVAHGKFGKAVIAETTYFVTLFNSIQKGDKTGRLYRQAKEELEQFL
jgi:hypothetical protein